MSEVTLSVVGLSSQEGTVVNVAANLLVALDHSIKVLGSGDHSGDIVLLSPSSEVGQAALSTLDGGQHALLFVDDEAEAKGYLAVTRPVRVQTLRDALIELLQRLPANRAPRAKAPTAAAEMVTNRAPSADLPGNLFYKVLDAVVHGSLTRIVCGGSNIVLIHGPSKTIYTRVDGMTLEKISQQPPEMLRAETLGESDFLQAAKGMSITRLHDVIWLAERHGSRGVLLPGHSMEVPIRLKVWPKFNSRHVRPEYLKLAALLSRQPLTLKALAEAGGVSLAHAIDFYNASVAFDVIEEMASAPVATPSPKPASSGGLLGMIAKKLALKRD